MKRAEIIAVGTEILMGQITNSNATFLSRELAELGVYVYFHTVVGDNPARLREVIEIAEARSDLLIFTGGLGPTPDDITKQILAEHLGKDLVIDEPHLKKISDYFTISKRPMTENNKLQALVIQGSAVLKNDFGFAAGMFLTSGRSSYMLLPGPPSEMKPMFKEYARPLIAASMNGDSIHLESRILHFFGIGESKLANDLADLIEQQTNPTLATYASDNEVEIRLTASARTQDEALQLLDNLEAEILCRDGEFVYGYGDTTLADVAISKLLLHHITIAAAESLTAGLFQAELGDRPGISEIFRGGMVTYHTDIKEKLLGVSHDVIKREGVVSAACAKEMAEQIRLKCEAQMGISFTGVAGPESLEGHPPGTVFIGLSVAGYATETHLFTFGRDRNHNRYRAVKQGFQLINRFLEEKLPKSADKNAR
ncbi:competence damage-inducible protein A [Listeria floridensis FSL S10-1187]|uniref:Putative competence-damage inducible protein n=1 Tax=Listeria floridensis FSL S10-1187 TaxID=1265817 RepID=A0ABP3AY27_9LIST|nr:competence/damage-inducible protein A [Listeria floridensis]EUJ31829.1 competence damage-inducible protein A [Listeria floridensis FSL S10-1187]